MRRRVGQAKERGDDGAVRRIGEPFQESVLPCRVSPRGDRHRLPYLRERPRIPSPCCIPGQPSEPHDELTGRRGQSGRLPPCEPHGADPLPHRNSEQHEPCAKLAIAHLGAPGRAGLRQSRLDDVRVLRPALGRFPPHDVHRNGRRAAARPRVERESSQNSGRFRRAGGGSAHSARVGKSPGYLAPPGPPAAFSQADQGGQPRFPGQQLHLPKPSLQFWRRVEPHDLHLPVGRPRADHPAAALVEPHRRPGQIVMHHTSRALQVEAFRRNVGGHEMHRHQARVRQRLASILSSGIEPAEYVPARQAGRADARRIPGAPGNPVSQAVAQPANGVA